MQYLNLDCRLLDSVEYLACEPCERGTWLNLMRYCAGQENGGVIRGCREWKSRQWEQVVRITKDEAEKETALWHWEGVNMVVFGYPIEQQESTIRLRERGREAIKKRWKGHAKTYKNHNGKKGLFLPPDPR
jgi:hypothetical protein